MKPRTLWAFALILTLAAMIGGAHASRRAGDRLQIVYRAQDNGHWQVFVFGLQPCDSASGMHIVAPANSTQPLELRCGK